MEIATRRWVARFVRIGLVLVAIAFVGVWISHHVPHAPRNVRVTRRAPDAASLGPGDLRIYSRDSAVDLVLVRDQILSGLSPKTIEKVRTKMDAQRSRDSTGLGALISQEVRSAVAENIGIHVMYPLAEVRNVRYEDGHIIIDRVHGGETQLFNNVQVSEDSHRGEGVTFSPEDAQRFIAAVRARKAELGFPPPSPP